MKKTRSFGRPSGVRGIVHWALGGAGIVGSVLVVCSCAQGSGGNGEACGNGQRDTGEQCDGDDVGGTTCEDLGLAAGTVSCNTDCTYDTSGCGAAGCGNEIIEVGEACDGPNLGGESCQSQGFDGGDLACGTDCQYDVTGCTLASCGNGQIDTAEECDDGDTENGDGCGANCRVEPGWSCTGVPSVCTNRCGNEEVDTGEDCDGENLNGANCETLGFDGGQLSCTHDCHYDTAACTGTPCGNGNIDPTEECDGSNLNGQDCVSLGYVGGTLACFADCSFDISGCTTCGNNQVDAGEECDGADLAGETCESQGFAGGGTLVCLPGCAFDTSGCDSGLCGNNQIDTGEQCDGSNLNGQNCVSRGYVGGTLACTANCTFDESGCSSTAQCGNGTVEGTEQCDDGNTTGGDGCSGGCQWETTCSANTALACGGSHSGNLLLANDSASFYDCGTEDASGGDRIYNFTASNSGLATVFLDVQNDNPLFGDNVDVYVLEGACNPQLCVAFGEANGDDTVNFNVTAGLTYFIVVELERLGFPPSSSYSIQLGCP